MKKSLFIVLALITTLMAAAQPTWTIKHNNKILLKTKTENESKNVVKIKKTDLDKKGNLTISYLKSIADAAWNRSVMLTDSSGNTIAENLDATTFKNTPTVISFPMVNSALKELLLKQKKIKIYTVSIPSDPALAATVRVRRVHLCTIELK